MQFWEKKIGLIGGGSSGLGLQLAREFARQQGLPVLVARNAERLKLAQQQLAEDNLRSDFIAADLSDSAFAAKAVEELIHRHGTLDLLVNAVGKSSRSLLGEATSADYREAMESNLQPAINTSLPALKHLAESSGHLVNIGSLSSRFPWPWMGPYATSKFALAGFTHQLRIESPANVHVMLVCPGPIRRTDGGLRYRDQTEGLPAEANQPGGGVQISGICPEKLAQKILKGCRKRQSIMVMPAKARILDWIYAVSADWGDWVAKKFQSRRQP